MVAPTPAEPDPFHPPTVTAVTEPERTLSFHTEAAGLRILADEPFPTGWRRVTDELVADTIAQLRRTPDEIDRGVHAARKNLKRMRAMLRLVRPSLPGAGFTETNRALRDIGRSLSPARDAWVMMETLSGIYDRYDDLVADGAFSAAERLFSSRYGSAMGRLPAAADRAAVDLVAVAHRLRDLESPPDRFSEVGVGMGRVYRSSRAAMRQATADADAAAFHEWRKRVKDLRYQLELIQPVQPVLIGAMTTELDRLGDLLGLDHDLVVLGETVRSEPASGRNNRERWLILALAHEWRAELQTAAIPLGTALHGESPKAFVTRIAGYWEAGRSR